MSGQNPFKHIQIATLPVSGARVRVRRPSLMTMVTTGGLPSELTSMALNVAGNKPVLPTGTEMEDIKRTFEIIEAFIPYVLVDIKLSHEQPTKLTQMGDSEDGQYWSGTLNYSDLQDVDKQFLFMVGRGVIKIDDEDEKEERKEASEEDLGKFRDGTDSSDAGHSSEEVRTETEQPAGIVAREPVSP